MENPLVNNFDVLIIGAGAAGLMCAVEAGKRGRRVAVLERSSKPGEKIRISGGGRCNFTNLNASPAQYLSSNPHFCKSALARYAPRDFLDLVGKHGIKWHEKTLGQLFCDSSSRQIIDMLLAECADVGVKIFLETETRALEKRGDRFYLDTSQGPFAGEALVIATGGPSIPKMGASGFAYHTARQFGLNVIEPVPALVPLTFTDEILALTKALSGLSVDPAVVSCGKTSFREALLFTHRGLSGPAILQISSYWTPGQEIVINLCPDKNVKAALEEARRLHPKKKLPTVLAELVPQRLAEVVAHQAGGNGVENVADLPDKMLREVARALCEWRVKPNGTEGFRTAEVTKGGVDTDELSSKTFAARKVPGLYFIGEAVDVTGWLGGYNFQWAWSSGWCCGQEA